jgi:hypothetical protein
MTDTRERGKVDFQDVAKLATQPQSSTGSEEEKKENSGIVHLSALAAGEPPATGSGQGERPSQEVGSPGVALATDPPAIAAPLDHRSPTRPDPLPRTVSRSRWTAWIALAAGVALGALLAGTLFTIRTQRAAQANRTMAALSQPQSLSAVPATPSNHGPPVSAAESTAKDRPVDSPVLASAPVSGPPRPSASGGPRLSVSAAPTMTALPTTSNTAPTTTAASPVSPAATASVAHLGTDDVLETLMKRSVGDHAAVPGARPAAAAGPAETAPATEGLPAKPSMGAVQGALGTVMPATRYCLGPDDPVSRATITFKSDGSVQTIAVAGDAAGHPAEGCIRSRLMDARVPPFASPTFTWTVTVRPAN